jgi:hypothetical protein
MHALMIFWKVSALVYLLGNGPVEIKFQNV